MNQTLKGISYNGRHQISGSMSLDDYRITWRGGDDVHNYEPNDIKQVFWCPVANRYQIRFVIEGGHSITYEGFSRSDYDILSPYMESKFNVKIQRESLGSSGANWGTTDFEGADGDVSMVMKDIEGRRVFEIGLSELSQCALPSKNDIELQFVEEDTTLNNEESLVSLSLFVPQGEDYDLDSSKGTASQRLQKMIIDRAGLTNTDGNLITELSPSLGNFITPRGRFTMEFYDNYMRMNGANYVYSVLYKTISAVYMFDLDDEVHKALVFCLTKPLRRGSQTYPHLVLRCTVNKAFAELNADESVLQERFGEKIHQHMSDAEYKLVAKLFKFIGKVKLYSSDSFVTAKGRHFVRAWFKSHEGLMYFTERSVFYIYNPTIQIPYEEIKHVKFSRYEPGQRSGNKSFDMDIKLEGTDRVIAFKNLHNEDFSAISAKLKEKGIMQQGIKHAQVNLEDDDDDDDDFDDNSAAGEQAVDEDFDGNGMDEESETSEEMKQLEPESDMEEEENPPKRQKMDD